MLTIDLEGARALLAWLERTRQGRAGGEEELEAVLAANAFAVDFYGSWDGCSREAVVQAIRCFDQPEQVPPGLIPSRLAEGLRQAAGEIDLLEGRMAWAGEIDACTIAGRILAALPPGTPLDATIHITVDALNNAFVSGREMGVSLLKGMDDPQTFADAVAHELHHVGSRYWAEQDAVLQRLAAERSGRAIAVLHVQNLLSEGMANFYLTPGYVFRASPQEPPADPFQAKLARLQRDENKLFAQAADILAQCLEPGAAYEACWEAVKAVAFDMEEALLPAGHYLGARMVQTMDGVHPRERIVGCMQRLGEFLPLYDEAARRAGGYVFDAQLAERFARLWEG